jgi:hypothetical protein
MRKTTTQEITTEITTQLNTLINFILNAKDEYELLTQDDRYLLNDIKQHPEYLATGSDCMTNLEIAKYILDCKSLIS